MPTIEHGVPVPKKRQRREGISATIRSMKHGDSVVIDSGAINAWRYAANMLGRGTRSQNTESGDIRLWIVDKEKLR